MLLQIVLLIAGLAGVLIGAEFLVNGSSSVAKKCGLSEFIIGMTIVGIGTSTPEMVVSYMGAFKGNSDIAIGNVIGSNIYNIGLILGVTALISPLVITRQNLRRDIPVSILATVMLLFFGFFYQIFGVGYDGINFWGGLILLLSFVLYLVLSFKNDIPDAESDDEHKIKLYPTWKAVIMIISGLALLVGGGRLFVDSATELAKSMGVSDKFIAITVVALGTSLPELATCVVAALKGRGQLALGNVIGSNIANILLILGGSAMIHEMSFANVDWVDAAFLFATVLYVLISSFLFTKNRLDRFDGAILLLMQIGYMTYLILNI